MVGMGIPLGNESLEEGNSRRHSHLVQEDHDATYAMSQQRSKESRGKALRRCARPVSCLRLADILTVNISFRVVDLAGARGLEPAASCLTGWRSNQLNYAPALDKTLTFIVVASCTVEFPLVSSRSIRPCCDRATTRCN